MVARLIDEAQLYKHILCRLDRGVVAQQTCARRDDGQVCVKDEFGRESCWVCAIGSVDFHVDLQIQGRDVAEQSVGERGGFECGQLKQIAIAQLVAQDRGFASRAVADAASQRQRDGRRFGLYRLCRQIRRSPCQHE